MIAKPEDAPFVHECNGFVNVTVSLSNTKKSFFQLVCCCLRSRLDVFLKNAFFCRFVFTGMSGSCSLRVCWRRLPAFRGAGGALAALHEGAALVRLAQRGGRRPARLRPARPDLKRPNKTDLVYLEESPDYCERNFT